MATTYITLDNLKRYDTNLKTWVNSENTNAFKAVSVKDNKINFYVNPSPAEDAVADAVIDIPVEYFLDQNKTVFVQEFAWSAETYVGATDPSLEGKPVLVLAVKGDGDTVAYSFVNLESLVDTYTTENTATVNMSIVDNKISGSVNVSAEEGNIISVKEDGLFAEAILDISGKADKLVNPETGDAVVKAGQILVDDGNGNIAASGKTVEELTNEILENFEAVSNDEIDSWFA